MRMPGFNADASLCMTKGYYYMTEGSAIAVQLNPANLIREMESTLRAGPLAPFCIGACLAALPPCLWGCGASPVCIAGCIAGTTLCCALCLAL
jgi:hypothetical protein